MRKVSTRALDRALRAVPYHPRFRTVDRNESQGELKATGAHLADDLDRSQKVREWVLAEGFNRAQEAFIVEGWKYERMKRGISENV